MLCIQHSQNLCTEPSEPSVAKSVEGGCYLQLAVLRSILPGPRESAADPAAASDKEQPVISLSHPGAAK